MGVVRRLTGDHRGAARLLDESLQVYLQVGDRLGRANALRQLGVLRRLTGDYAGATQALRESLSLYLGLGNRRRQAEALQELGVVRRLAGDPTQAAESFAEAHATFQDLGSRSGRAEVLNCIGMLLVDEGNPQALDRFRLALELAREIHNPLEEARALEGLARWSLRQNENSQGSRQLQAALEIYQRIGAPDAAQVRAALASLNTSP
jgi:tetratricopeptide (TPR) repeat protein